MNPLDLFQSVRGAVLLQVPCLGLLFWTVSVSFYHRLVMIWFHSDRPWGLWHVLGLFLLLLFIVWVIWVCINKLWGLWHFFRLSLCFFITGLFVTLCCSMLPTKRSPLASFFTFVVLPLYGDSITYYFWSLSTFLTQYCGSFFYPF